MPLRVSERPLQPLAVVFGGATGGGERSAADFVHDLGHDSPDHRPLELPGLGSGSEPLGDDGGEFIESAVDVVQRPLRQPHVHQPARVRVSRG
ncbi:hypothetical protein [Streptomyces albidochromogenes]|uniref:hypothetical protein n=1 Tax=Streptomyces albidochromogenes TaxID=329524 RepID=UPI00110F914A|nr:hypothetical protein [Streptomyces albidochromogenes]